MTLDWGFADPQGGVLSIPNADVTRLFETGAYLRAPRWRVDAYMPYIWKNAKDDPSIWDWTTIDRQMDACIAAGIRPLIVVDHRSKFAGSGFFGLFGSGKYPTAAQYGDFCAAVVTRYQHYYDGFGGGFDIELGNELNNAAYWGGSVNKAMFQLYSQYLIDAYPKIHAVVSAATVVSCGWMVVKDIADIERGVLTQTPLQALTYMYEFGCHGFMDAIGIHAYTDDPESSTDDPTPSNIPQPFPLQMVDDMRTLAVANGDTALDFWVTEWGYNSTNWTQAQITTWYAELVAWAQARAWIGPIFFCSLRDFGPAGKNGVVPRQDAFGAYSWTWVPKLVVAYLQTLSPLTASFTVHGGNVAVAMTAKDKEAAAFSLALTTGVGMSAEDIEMASFGISLTAGIEMDAVGDTPMAAFELDLTSGIQMTATELYTGAFNLGLTAGVGMSADDVEIASFGLSLTSAISMSAKLSQDYTLSGTTKPTGFVDISSQIASPGTNDLAASTVASGTLDEGTNASAGNITAYMITLLPDQTTTVLQDVKVTVGALHTNATNIGQGCACAFNGTTASADGVFCIGVGSTGGSFIEQIYSKVGNTITPQASQSSGTITAADVFEVKMTVASSIYTYTLYKNGTATGLSWTDSSSVITPGKYGGAAFMNSKTSGTDHNSRGVTRIQLADM